jgi:8-oxo-dGTP pyrophosphatase MutT (NUDIX family)
MKRDVIYEGKIINLVKLDDRWEVIEHPPAVTVLALRGREVLGVTQPRPALGQTTWELPAGLVDEGETPEEAALRELAEETQLTGTLSFIAQAYTSPGFSDEKIYVYEAVDLQEKAGEPDAGEEITIAWRDLDEVWQAIQRGDTLTSAPTAIALAYAVGRFRNPT